jgi:hypothetical protein
MSQLVFESLLEFQRGKPSEALSLGKRKDVEEWIKKYIPFSRAKINSEWTIDTKDVVIPSNKYMTEFPEYIQLNICDGDCLIRDQNLKSMIGCPKIVKGDFMVDRNKLVDLDGCPEEVSGDFFIKGNDKKFTVDEIKKVCNVGGRISV